MNFNPTLRRHLDASPQSLGLMWKVCDAHTQRLLSVESDVPEVVKEQALVLMAAKRARMAQKACTAARMDAEMVSRGAADCEWEYDESLRAASSQLWAYAEDARKRSVAALQELWARRERCQRVMDWHKSTDPIDS